MHNFVVTCDGGSLGNGTKDSVGYGSFIVERGNSETKSVQFRHTFGAGITNNEAEYMIAIEALKLIKSVLEASGEKVSNNSILIYSDSALVIGQCSNGWKVKAVRIMPLFTELMNLINEFSSVEFNKISGDHMKRILGH
jgi:ribonuclease HI